MVGRVVPPAATEQALADAAGGVSRPAELDPIHQSLLCPDPHPAGARARRPPLAANAHRGGGHGRGDWRVRWARRRRLGTAMLPPSAPFLGSAVAAAGWPRTSLPTRRASRSRLTAPRPLPWPSPGGCGAARTSGCGRRCCGGAVSDGRPPPPPPRASEALAINIEDLDRLTSACGRRASIRLTGAPCSPVVTVAEPRWGAADRRPGREANGAALPNGLR